MAAWQVDFYIVPKRALTTSPPLTAELVDTTDWWTDSKLPADYLERLNAIASPAPSRSAGAEAWGDEDGNGVEVWSVAGRPTRIRARVDVRRPDAKFAAGLITFARAAAATLVRTDGRVTEPTAGGFGLALRESAAWRVVYKDSQSSV